MTRDQAAKLAQAYQWLSEGKKVEFYNGKYWRPWDGLSSKLDTFRIKHETLELWANVYKSGIIFAHRSAATARKDANQAVRVAVHMREVRDEPNT